MLSERMEERTDKERTNIQLSLDEIIQKKRLEAASTSSSSEPIQVSLNSYIMALNFGERTNSVIPKSCYNYNKALDDIIYEQRVKRGTIAPTDNAEASQDKASSSKYGAEKYHQKPVPPSVVLKPMDPCTTALNDMIEQAAAADVERPNPVVKPSYKRKLQALDENDPMSNSDLKNKEICQRQYLNLTPYRAVGFLSDNGMIIEIVTGKLSEGTTGNEDRLHLWRCIVKCGEIKGTADSIRKVVAREMACKHFLIQLGEIYQNVCLPKYWVLDELFIDPRLFNLLEKIAAEKMLKIRHDVRVKHLNPENELRTKRNIYYSFICTYFVGEEKFIGEHYIIEYAKLLAARAAYGFITGTGREPRPTKYFTGEECGADLQYDFNESETFQTIAKINVDGTDLTHKDSEEPKC